MNIQQVIESDWSLLLALLPSELELEVSARQCGALSRRRGVAHAADVLRLALAYSVCGMSLRQTAAWADAEGVASMSDVAVLQRLKKASNWLSSLVGWTLRQRVGQPVCGALPYRLRLVDATCISQPGSKGTDWRVHLGLTLPDLRIDHVELTDVHGGETLRRLPVQPGDLVVADRGYAHRQGLAAVCEAGGNFLVRANWHNLPMRHPDGSPVAIIEAMRGIEGCDDLPVLVPTDSGALSARLVILRLPDEEADKARKRITKERRKKGRVDPRTIEAAGYVAVLTSVPAEHLDKDAVMALYRFRWQIELAFKRLKSLLDLDTLTAKDPDLARTTLYAKLLAALWLDELTVAFSPRLSLALPYRRYHVGISNVS